VSSADADEKNTTKTAIPSVRKKQADPSMVGSKKTSFLLLGLAATETAEIRAKQPSQIS
jgi:hypothetical protein